MKEYCQICGTRMFNFGGKPTCINVKAHDRIGRENSRKSEKQKRAASRRMTKRNKKDSQ